jgi:peptidoglycan-N-acetylglucosamine deacetylase
MCVALLSLALFSAPALSALRVALSFDDGFDPVTEPGAAELNARLLAGLASRGVRAIYFVAGSRVDTAPGLDLVAEWSRAGHYIANHSYAHRNFNSSDATVASFAQDVLRNERLLAAQGRWVQRFRFPYLKEGNTAEKRDGFRAWLDANGYATGAVTIDTSDWYYNRRLEQRFALDPAADLAAYGNALVAHLLDRASYYAALGRAATGRDVDHVLLLHTNRINALFVGEVIDAMRSAGWTIIDPLEAYQDPVFQSRPETIPAGESLVWAIAREAGIEGLRYPAEDGRYERSGLDALGL